jgi:hypothetical protein
VAADACCAAIGTTTDAIPTIIAMAIDRDRTAKLNLRVIP